MGVLTAAMTAMKGYGDKFDAAIGVIEWVEELLGEADIPAEIHTAREDDLASQFFDGVAGVETHVHDPKGEMAAELARAKELIEEARQIMFKVLGEMP